MLIDTLVNRQAQHAARPASLPTCSDPTPEASPHCHRSCDSPLNLISAKVEIAPPEPEAL
jgi:hypothetical protein